MRAQSFGKSQVFRLFLNCTRELDCLRDCGSSFQSDDAATLKALSPVLERLDLIDLSKPVLEERNCLTGAYQLNFFCRGTGPIS